MNAGLTWAAPARGFGLGLGLIVAIGAQNAFVLRQGLRREHVPAVALTCALCDALLISLGAGGIGTLIASSAVLRTASAWVGAAFLLFYGARSLWSALAPGALRIDEGAATNDLRKTVLTALTFSLLNPHAILDTVVLVGGVAGQYAMPSRAAFAAGAMMASVAWFFGLAYGAGRLAPLFQRPAACRVLDLCVGFILLGIALSLIRGVCPVRNWKC